MQPTPQNNQLMSKHRVLSLKPQLRLECRRQDGQSETEQPDHSASLGDSIRSSTRIRFSVHTGGFSETAMFLRQLPAKLMHWLAPSRVPRPSPFTLANFVPLARD